MPAQPACDTLPVRGQSHELHARRAARMVRRQRPRKPHAIPPLDEERQPGLSRCDIDTRATPGDELAARRDPRPSNDLQAKPAPDSLDRMVRTAQPTGRPGSPLAI